MISIKSVGVSHSYPALFGLAALQRGRRELCTLVVIQRSLRLKLDKYQNIAIALSFDSVSVLSILFLTILYKGG